MSTKLLKTVLIALVAVAVIAVGIVFATRFERSNQAVPQGAGTSTVFLGNVSTDPIPTPETPDLVNFDGKDYTLREELSTLLILGTDDEAVDEDEGNLVYSQADFLVLAVFDNEAKTCTLLQIDRNTMANIDVLDDNDQITNTMFTQICLSHDFGTTPDLRCRNTANALSRLLYNVPINNFAAMAMGGIPSLNDAAGGVTVTIEDDFTGVDDTLVKGETVKLMGEHAFNYVHARMTMKDDDSNIARMRRHRTYMKALVEQLRAKSEQDPAFALEVFNAVADYLVTDCEVDELSDYVNGLSEYELTGIVTLEGVTEMTDHEEFYPDEEKLMQLVIDLFFEPYEA